MSLSRAWHSTGRLAGSVLRPGACCRVYHIRVPIVDEEPVVKFVRAANNAIRSYARGTLTWEQLRVKLLIPSAGGEFTDDEMARSLWAEHGVLEHIEEEEGLESIPEFADPVMLHEWLIKNQSRISTSFDREMDELIEEELEGLEGPFGLVAGETERMKRNRVRQLNKHNREHLRRNAMVKRLVSSHERLGYFQNVRSQIPMPPVRYTPDGSRYPSNYYHNGEPIVELFGPMSAHVKLLEKLKYRATLGKRRGWLW